MVIPSGVTNIGVAVFDGCDRLSSIEVESGNKKYHSSGNCIIETETGKAIQGCNYSVILDNGSVKSIGVQAFAGCNGLSSIVIPDSVTSIGEGAFYNCTNLSDVYYTGTEEQWNSITVGIDNECLTGAVIHFNYVG